MCATTKHLEQRENESAQGLATSPRAREPRKEVKENLLRGICNRLFQQLARTLPGARSLRVALHRARGVHIENGVWIGYDVTLDTSRPYLITIKERASLSMHVTVIAHFRESQGVRIEQDAFIGPGAIILPSVTIGRGAVVTAGSVVTQSVPAMTVVQGNPAIAIATCGIPLSAEITLKEFSRHLTPLNKKSDSDIPENCQTPRRTETR